MKILFYDGYLDENIVNVETFIKYQICVVIDAAMGPRKVLKYFQENYSQYPDMVVLTNSLIGLTDDFGWNKAENRTDIYFWSESKQDFVRADELTNKEIRKESNILHMFLSSVFRK